MFILPKRVTIKLSVFFFIVEWMWRLGSGERGGVTGVGEMKEQTHQWSRQWDERAL